MRNIYFKYMKNAFSKQKIIMIFQILIIILSAGIVTILPIIHQSIINNIFIENDFKNFNVLVLFMASLYIFQCGFDILKDFIKAKMEVNIKFKLRKKLNAFIARKNYSEYLKQGSEQVITKYNTDANVISGHFSESIFELFEQIVILIFAICMIIKVNVPMLVYMSIFLGLYFVLNKIISKVLQKAIKTLLVYQEESLGCFSENYSNNFLVKIYNLYNWIDKRFSYVYRREYMQNIKTDVMYSLNVNITRFSVNILIIFSWIVGGYYIKTGKGSVGDVVALTEYVSILVSPFFYLGQFNNNLQETNSSIERFESEFAVPCENINVGKRISEIKDVYIENIVFKYDENDEFILKLDGVRMKKGELIGIKGKSGCGKTTLINLLMGLYNVKSGTIYINNIDYKNYNLECVREHIGYIPQNSLFFEETIRKNLFGNYKQKDIDNLAKKIDIYHDIHRMQNGFEYVLKKNASNISGGQQKRIDVLRVLLANKDIIIFDEVTAMLDKKRRNDLFKIVMELKKQKIIIMITHNSSEWGYFDKILEL